VTPHDWLGLGIGGAELLLGIVVLVPLARFARTFPWLVALTLFFVVRGATRVWEGLAGARGEVPVATDALVLLVLGSLTVGLPATIRRLRDAEDSAALRRQEYERALADYRALARHRLANAVTIIRGSADTLLCRSLDDDLRTTLLHAISREAGRLEDAVEPAARMPEEQVLDPLPTRALATEPLERRR
jgi:signal transduction histidine kinase